MAPSAARMMAGCVTLTGLVCYVGTVVEAKLLAVRKSYRLDCVPVLAPPFGVVLIMELSAVRCTQRSRESSFEVEKRKVTLDGRNRNRTLTKRDVDSRCT